MGGAGNGGRFLPEVAAAVDSVARQGSTPLVVADGAKVLGVIELKDIVKGGIKERFAQLRRMGIRTVMITGDNRLTAAAIAAEAGVDDFLAEATPEAKLKLIRDTQAGGRLVAMTGDGTNDAPALAQADVAVAMNTGTQAAKEAGNMVDLDSNPTKLIEIVEIGKQLLITRGALTTFSIANDVAKYFAIIPAAFASTYPQLNALNVMHLASPASAILSAVIFNALIIIALIPLALRGVKYRPIGAAALLRNNLLDLWRRRHHRAVHRHQGHRPDAGGDRTGVKDNGHDQRAQARISDAAASDTVDRRRLSAAGHRHRPGGDARSGQRQSDHARRQAGRLRADRPAVLQPEVLLVAAVGYFALPVQRVGLVRIQPGPDQSCA